MTAEQEQPVEGVRVNDRRRIDPLTYAVREQASPAPASAGVADAAMADSEAVLEADLTAVDAKVVELTDDLRRVHAEYANYRKRVDRDREAARDVTVGGVLADLLPVLDDIDRAREHGELEGAFKAVGETLEAICARLGLEVYGLADEPFDPAIHEALTSETRDGLDGPIVVSVYQRGYRHAGRVLRPARVAVADA
ncbi:MAG: nucleotide exchange factor GrpE [Candidatus Nanopelagicales bacterium]|nr:nucleotide exchange factor GrpE [Candidatus Nanopelagicales bacterium]MDP4714998.1 nucleotide exchange factor GrpE [Candidatus Nanopelagicales bacterium]MDP4906235.1 nucleotide exchange factor GrpE [Candidatus Nanopelagicales bacterium]MDP4974101.1 nucleotide exchange factor GrpE [Candidatus Nanopelagicales bacterium]MDP5095440.1 nucleotide exchange factor GrpE [Candidatus Nanopelagicales bacterium]